MQEYVDKSVNKDIRIFDTISVFVDFEIDVYSEDAKFRFTTKFERFLIN